MLKRFLLTLILLFCVSCELAIVGGVYAIATGRGKELLPGNSMQNYKYKCKKAGECCEAGKNCETSDKETKIKTNDAEKN